MNKLKKFVLDVKAEMVKVSWPSREELMSSTSVVIISVIILAAFVGMLDLFFTYVVGLIVK